jgi:hypothetical protein
MELSKEQSIQILRVMKENTSRSLKLLDIIERLEMAKKILTYLVKNLRREHENN